MALHFARTGYAFSRGSANDLPDGDWALGGWVRIVDGHGTAAPQILEQDTSTLARFSLVYYEDQYAEESYRQRFTVSVRDALGQESRIDSAGTYAANDGWQHVLVERSGGMIRLYVDGQADAVAAPAGGAVVIDGDNVFGRLGVVDEAEWAKWDRAIGLGEIAALAKGYSPRFLTEERKWHLPMVRHAQELDGPLVTGLVDAQAAPHPPLWQPTGLRIARSGTGPPGASRPYRAVVGLVWHTGAGAGALDVAGQRAGQVQSGG